MVLHFAIARATVEPGFFAATRQAETSASFSMMRGLCAVPAVCVVAPARGGGGGCEAVASAGDHTAIAHTISTWAITHRGFLHSRTALRCCRACGGVLVRNGCRAVWRCCSLAGNCVTPNKGCIAAIVARRCRRAQRKLHNSKVAEPLGGFVAQYEQAARTVCNEN